MKMLWTNRSKNQNKLPRQRRRQTNVLIVIIFLIDCALHFYYPLHDINHWRKKKNTVSIFFVLFATRILILPLLLCVAFCSFGIFQVNFIFSICAFSMHLSPNAVRYTHIRGTTVTLCTFDRSSFFHSFFRSSTFSTQHSTPSAHISQFFCYFHCWK